MLLAHNHAHKEHYQHHDATNDDLNIKALLRLKLHIVLIRGARTLNCRLCSYSQRDKCMRAAK